MISPDRAVSPLVSAGSLAPGKCEVAANGLSNFLGRSGCFRGDTRAKTRSARHGGDGRESPRTMTMIMI